MGLDLGRLKQRAEENAFSGSRWKVKKAPVQNFVRVFKFTHKVTEADVKAGFFTKEKLGKTVEEFDRGVTLQYGFAEKKRPILATKETLAKYEKLNNSSNSSNQEQAKAIKPSRKYLLNVVDMTEKPRKMRHWSAPSTAYNDILAVIMNPEFGEAVLGSAGRDFIVTHYPDKAPAEQYKVQLRDKDKSIKMDAALEAKVLDFYSDKGLKEVGLTLKPSTAPAAAEEETEEVEEETVEETPEEVAEETTEETAAEETAEEGTSDEGVGEEASEEGEAGDAEDHDETEGTEETPAEEPAEEPAKPAKKAAAPAKKLPPKKGAKK